MKLNKDFWANVLGCQMIFLVMIICFVLGSYNPFPLSVGDVLMVIALIDCAFIIVYGFIWVFIVKETKDGS